MKKNLIAMLAAVALTAGLATDSFALPMDESTLVAYNNPNNIIYIDWMVIDAGAINANYAGSYAYLYQLEVPVAANQGIEQFSVYFNTVGLVQEVGFLAGDDLDDLTAYHAAHTVGGEYEPTSMQAFTGTGYSQDILGGSVTWQFDPFSGVYESDTMYFIHPNPPTLGDGRALDGTAWVTDVQGAELVPVPTVPDATATIILLGAAVMGLGLAARKLA